MFLTLKSAEDTATTKIPAWMPFLRGRTLDQARDVADEAVTAWRAKGLAIATINRRLAVLRRVLALAHSRWDWLQHDIACVFVRFLAHLITAESEQLKL